MPLRPLEGRVALVTGANHGIGASTALALVGLGANVVVTYLRLDVPDDDPGRPAAYAQHRRQDATVVIDAIRAAGSNALAIEADLADPASPARLFDQAEDAFGPVAILVNNASGWRQDTFTGASVDTLGRPNRAVTAESIDAQLLVDALASALLIAELARRHGQWGADWGGSSASPPEDRVGSPARSPTVPPKPPWRTTRCRRPLNSPRWGSRRTSFTRP